EHVPASGDSRPDPSPVRTTAPPGAVLITRVPDPLRGRPYPHGESPRRHQRTGTTPSGSPEENRLPTSPLRRTLAGVRQNATRAKEVPDVDEGSGQLPARPVCPGSGLSTGPGARSEGPRKRVRPRGVPTPPAPAAEPCPPQAAARPAPAVAPRPADREREGPPGAGAGGRRSRPRRAWPRGPLEHLGPGRAGPAAPAGLGG